jgi:hypothetical protein
MHSFGYKDSVITVIFNGSIFPDRNGEVSFVSCSGGKSTVCKSIHAAKCKITRGAK